MLLLLLVLLLLLLRCRVICLFVVVFLFVSYSCSRPCRPSSLPCSWHSAAPNEQLPTPTNNSPPTTNIRRSMIPSSIQMIHSHGQPARGTTSCIHQKKSFRPDPFEERRGPKRGVQILDRPCFARHTPPSRGAAQTVIGKIPLRGGCTHAVLFTKGKTPTDILCTAFSKPTSSRLYYTIDDG